MVIHARIAIAGKLQAGIWSARCAAFTGPAHQAFLMKFILHGKVPFMCFHSLSIGHLTPWSRCNQHQQQHASMLFKSICLLTFLNSSRSDVCIRVIAG